MVVPPPRPRCSTAHRQSTKNPGRRDAGDGGVSESRQTLDTAIQAYAQKEWDGELVVDWVLIAATVDEDGHHSIGAETSRENMPRYAVVGLLHEGLRMEDETDE